MENNDKMKRELEELRQDFGTLIHLINVSLAAPLSVWDTVQFQELVKRYPK